MKIGAIIFSRFSSSRLPGKAFIDVSGKTLLERVIDRTKLIKSVDHISLATSINSEDDTIASYGKSRDIDVFRGSLHDVSGRAMGACKKFEYDHFIRICADRPFLDASLYDHLISNHLINKCDLTTNIFPRIVPPGFTGEVLKVKKFIKMLESTNNSEDREHVTRYFYKNPSNFLISNVEFKKEYNLPELRLVIDDTRDLKRARWIAEKINDTDFVYNSNKIISFAQQWEKLNIK